MTRTAFHIEDVLLIIGGRRVFQLRRLQFNSSISSGAAAPKLTDAGSCAPWHEHTTARSRRCGDHAAAKKVKESLSERVDFKVCCSAQVARKKRLRLEPSATIHHIDVACDVLVEALEENNRCYLRPGTRPLHTHVGPRHCLRLSPAQLLSTKRSLNRIRCNTVTAYSRLSNLWPSCESLYRLRLSRPRAPPDTTLHCSVKLH